MMYICKDCGQEFPTEEANRFMPQLGCPVEDWDYEYDPICPYCDSFNLEEREDDEWES